MSNPDPNCRRGSLLAAVLACLALAAVLTAVWLRLIVLEHDYVRRQQVALQAEYLASAALDRAAARLDADPTYAGETWNVSAASFAGTAPATIAIQVETPDDDPDARLVSVQAAYPASGPLQAQRVRSERIHLPTKEPMQ